jgi:hypothetical protein
VTRPLRAGFLINPDRFEMTYAYATLPADGNVALVVNTFYSGSIAGYSADRTATLPASASVGDRIAIAITTGDDAYELLITANTGDTLNGIAGGTEWSRLFISGEVVIMVCIVADTTWIVEYDGRIAQKALMRLSTSASAEVANTTTQPTAKGGVWTVESDNASIATAASNLIKTRRAGIVRVTAGGESSANIGDQNYFAVYVYKNGVADLALYSQVVGSGTALHGVVPPASQPLPVSADDFFVYLYASQQGSRGLLATALPRFASALSLEEVL